MDVSLHTDTLTLQVSACPALNVSADVGQCVVDTISIAANAAVVMAMFLIFIEELLALQIVNAIRGT